MAVTAPSGGAAVARDRGNVINGLSLRSAGAVGVLATASEDIGATAAAAERMPVGQDTW